ncbi:hypothetical protein A2627_01460 [Candidatus Woesebacteria bacterium RIFCSPHIGHO2_01_FULL_39_28]|uniref:Uncharacterized protein n=1 Tax=Candidatus Woesebacteria bacterium RIFCSPHIGHO2_01_FULL_39_28 TaxID=1802496 RepID=A0A1F7YH89_9BACT|nr:MAG: hypothetical protein A2627_01460 [Candidatus Woesebacteria bacterium RIFCSPHIGHO2_01_FULL_39_28]OGM57628.1 MAG: hypothetical protein A3A50_01310 [Candidatus Woesebacteria bacterium RIFCSPLOWO2_01_FULL_38_20]
MVKDNFASNTSLYASIEFPFTFAVIAPDIQIPVFTFTGAGRKAGRHQVSTIATSYHLTEQQNLYPSLLKGVSVIRYSS